MLLPTNDWQEHVEDPWKSRILDAVRTKKYHTQARNRFGVRLVSSRRCLTLGASYSGICLRLILIHDCPIIFVFSTERETEPNIRIKLRTYHGGINRLGCTSRRVLQKDAIKDLAKLLGRCTKIYIQRWLGLVHLVVRTHQSKHPALGRGLARKGRVGFQVSQCATTLKARRSCVLHILKMRLHL